MVNLYACVPNFVSIGLFCRPLAAINPKFCCFFGLRHFVVSSIGSNMRKLNTDAQPQTFPYQRYQNRFCILTRLLGEIVRTISDVHKRDEQTNRQTDKKLNVLAASAADEIRAPPNLA